MLDGEPHVVLLLCITIRKQHREEGEEEVGPCIHAPLNEGDRDTQKQRVAARSRDR